MVSRRRSKKDETPNCGSFLMGDLFRRQINGITAGMRSIDHKNVQTDPQLFLEHPIFNIHIHIPAYRGGNFQMYLPRLHPIVHLHFDEIARKLEIRRGQNEQATYRLFKKLLAMTSPTYGDVKFYNSHRLGEGGFIESQVLPTSVTTMTSSSESIPTGGGLSVNEVTENIQNTVSVRSNYEGRSSVRNNHQSPEMGINQINTNPRKRSMSDLEKEFKLKKAVVVLTDVCKTKYYKNLFNTSNEQRIEESHDGLNRIESEQYSSKPCEKHFIKTEIELPEPEEEIQENQEIHHHPLNEVKSVQSEENMNYAVAKTLTSLVEGCNFSEILHRFKVKKCEEHLVDSIKNLNAPTVENFVNNSEHNFNSETSEQDSYHEDKFMVNETWGGDNVTSGVESERPVEEDFHWKINNGDSKKISTCWDVKLPLGSLNASTNTQSDIDHGLLDDDRKLDDDVNELSKMVSNQRIIRATSNSEIEILSCGTSPFLVPVNRFQFLKSNESNSETNSNINFQLELMKEEMARKNMNISKNSNKNSKKGVKKKPLKSPSLEGKKSKASKQQKTDNSSRADDYIPLQATGPTKFAVAPLNKISPYKSHNARNFKDEMLFGNGVNRFQNANHLRTYKLKKYAGRRTTG